jgi:hypothetical protein
MTDQLTPRQKISLLVKKHELGFMVNPGGAQFTNRQKGIKIHVRIRLAACGVVAKADTPESAKEARDIHPDYHSASLDDVISMVDALMAARAKQARGREVADPAPVEGGLVERVARAIHTRVATVDVELWKPEARAAILEVAKWLRKQGLVIDADLLEQESGR